MFIVQLYLFKEINHVNMFFFFLLMHCSLHWLVFILFYAYFLQWSKCNRIETWTGPLAHLSLSDVVLLDKDQGSQSGIGSLLLLFPGCERKLEELNRDWKTSINQSEHRENPR